MPDDLRDLLLDPRVVLSLLVGAFHTCTYLFIRGRAGWRVLAVLAAACAGAFAGQAVASRLGDLLWIGELGLLWTSLLAWAGIGLVVAAAALLPGGRRSGAEAGRIGPRGRGS